jgi:hypothetical protein
MDSNQEEREGEALAEEEAEAAEAGSIGVEIAKDSEDSAKQPLINVPPPSEEQSYAVYGEADEAIPEDE